jgi:replication fork clamp-binding protein CrfC
MALGNLAASSFLHKSPSRLGSFHDNLRMLEASQLMYRSEIVEILKQKIQLAEDNKLRRSFESLNNIQKQIVKEQS